MTDLLENPFWQYSLKLYTRDGVESLCLHLQEGYGVNVNVLLWACWLAERRAVLDEAKLQQGLTLLAPFQRGYVEPLREMRNTLALPIQQVLRKKILAAELEAEKVVQKALYDYFTGQCWEAGDNQVELLSENLSCVLGYYSAAEALPKGLAMLS